jgi:hypothetical protein
MFRGGACESLPFRHLESQSHKPSKLMARMSTDNGEKSCSMSRARIIDSEKQFAKQRDSSREIKNV